METLIISWNIDPKYYRDERGTISSYEDWGRVNLLGRPTRRYPKMPDEFPGRSARSENFPVPVSRCFANDDCNPSQVLFAGEI